MRWHILTGEYPPQPGGVSDYTRLVARELAAHGDRIVVWAPPADGPEPEDPGVDIRRLPDHFGLRSMAAIARALTRDREPRRVLVQYVPHAFGWKALNLPFCAWLRLLGRGTPVWVMFHEVAFPFDREQPLAHNVLAVGTRMMASMAARAAERVFVSIPEWTTTLGELAPECAPEWIPVPCTIPCTDEPVATAALRERYAGRAGLVGHFGTYGEILRPTLRAVIHRLLDRTDCHVLLFGRGSEQAVADITSDRRALCGRVHGTGELTAAEVSRHVRSCDLMLQPFPDGVSSRRTSVMISLSQGRPIVTTSGWLTEPLWAESQSVVLVPAGDIAGIAAAAAAVLNDPARAARLGARARDLYETRFHLRHTVTALRGTGEAAEPLLAVS